LSKLNQTLCERGRHVPRSNFSFELFDQGDELFRHTHHIGLQSISEGAHRFLLLW